MRIGDRIIAGVVWLQKYSIFSPMNLRENPKMSGVEQWGNYAIGYNMYPNLFNIFVQYSPSASRLVEKRLDLTFGNIPKEVKNKRTTHGVEMTNTLYSCVRNAGRDAIMYERSWAIWVGYNEDGLIDEFSWIPLENIRYVVRDESLYPHSKSEYMIGLLGDSAESIGRIFYPYDPSQASEQYGSLEAWKAEHGNDRKSMNLEEGQILFYNTAKNQLYPDCVFNSMLPVLLSDMGVDTAIMSYLGNADLLKTYKKRPGTSGADAANGTAGILGGGLLGTVWGERGALDLTQTPQIGSDYYAQGTKTAGSTEYLTIAGDEAIGDWVKEPRFPQFMDELGKIDDRSARRICLALNIPYEYVYKMDSGVLNQENRTVLMNEINMMLEDDRDTFEGVFNSILDRSVFDWRLQVRPIGEGKEDVRDANENITRQ